MFNNLAQSDFRLAPHLGEDSREILLALGYSAAEIDRMVQSGILVAGQDTYYRNRKEEANYDKNCTGRRCGGYGETDCAC